MTNPDPARLVQLLTDAGWKNAGGTEGKYARLRLVNGTARGWNIIVPLDPAMADYDDLLRAVLAEMEWKADLGRRAQQVLDGLKAEAA